MLRKITVIALALFAFASVPRARAGTEMIIDNSAPAPRYNYAPPQPVYYAPPPPAIVVYPSYAYRAPIRVYGYHRVYGRRVHRVLNYCR